MDRKGRRRGELSRCHRPGYDQHALHHFRSRRTHGGQRTARARTDLSQAGLGGTRSGGNLATHAGSHCWRPAAAGSATLRSGRHWNHQPKRDDHSVGAQDGQAASKRHRLAGHAGRRLGRGVRKARRTGSLSISDGVASQHLFQRPEDSLAAGKRSRGPRAGGSGRCAVRQRGYVSRLAFDGWRGRAVSTLPMSAMPAAPS